MKCCKCGSQAINHGLHRRDGSDGDLCDVCYWRKRADDLVAAASKAVYLISNDIRLPKQIRSVLPELNAAIAKAGDV